MKIKKIKNKKASLSIGFVTSTIIAVLVILALVYLGAKVGTLFLNNKNMEKAEAVLGGLTQEINAIKGVEGGNVVYMILNPKNWYLMVREGRLYPNDCDSLNCLCFCEKIDCKCENERNCKDKVCEEFDFEIEIDNVEKGPVQGDVLTEYYNAERVLKIDKVPMELKISNNGGKVVITKNE